MSMSWYLRRLRIILTFVTGPWIPGNVYIACSLLLVCLIENQARLLKWCAVILGNAALRELQNGTTRNSSRHVEMMTNYCAKYKCYSLVTKQTYQSVLHGQLLPNFPSLRGKLDLWDYHNISASSVSTCEPGDLSVTKLLQRLHHWNLFHRLHFSFLHWVMTKWRMRELVI
jgi:hypothetical protein